jgi:LDH2 family malate/lactate/ureidoglycolate dehydrogenase
MRGRRICQEKGGECESKPDPAEFDEEEVEDVVFAGEVVDGCGSGGGHGVVRGVRIPGDWREDREERAEEEGCWVDEECCWRRGACRRF